MDGVCYPESGLGAIYRNEDHIKETPANVCASEANAVKTSIAAICAVFELYRRRKVDVLCSMCQGPHCQDQRAL